MIRAPKGCDAPGVRDAIAAEAGKRAKLSPSAVAALIKRVVEAPFPVFPALIRDGIDPELAVLSAATVTGLPPAPRLLMRNPNIPEGLDAIGLRDAGGVPLGTVQGRLWVAFSDPEAARAAIFSDDVVVCLGLDADLRAARSAFDAVYPSAAGDTLAMAAVTPAQVEAWRREQAELAKTNTKSKGNPETAAPTTTGSGPMRFKAPRGLTPAASTRPPDLDLGRVVDTAGDISTAPSVLVSKAELQRSPATTSSNTGAEVHTDNDSGINRALDPERLRLLRAAQLGRLRRFKFDRVVGSGGMATVYLAHDRERAGPPVAVKLLDPALASDATAVARFRREMRALASLKHPHIVAFVDGDADADAGVLWLACRFIDGGPLRALLEKTGPLPLVAALPIVAALLEAQEHAHGAGVVHRDLKPQNVLLGADGSLCLADFGVASAVGDVPVTRVGARLGTPAYMAPEQALGGDTDARADLFSTGLLFYEMLSGTNPFVRGTREETMRAIARADVPALPTSVSLPQRLRSWLEAMLAAPRDARPPSAKAALDVIRPFLLQCPPVSEVVSRLMRDADAFVGAPAVVDDADSTVGEDVEGAIIDDNHSAFGATVGVKATMELPRVSLGALSLSPSSSAPLPSPATAPDLSMVQASPDATVADGGDGGDGADGAVGVAADEGSPTDRVSLQAARSTAEAPPGDGGASVAPSPPASAHDGDGDGDGDAFAAAERRRMMLVLGVLALMTALAVAVMAWATSGDSGDDAAHGTAAAAVDDATE